MARSLPARYGAIRKEGVRGRDTASSASKKYRPLVDTERKGWTKELATTIWAPSRRHSTRQRQGGSVLRAPTAPARC